MARMLYFAWVRERIGCGEEAISLPVDVTTVAKLMEHLSTLGENYADTLQERNLRVAVNQNYSQPDDKVCDSDEVAIFPPVSGG
jgi:sulfur-carrier protein